MSIDCGQEVVLHFCFAFLFPTQFVVLRTLPVDSAFTTEGYDATSLGSDVSKESGNLRVHVLEWEQRPDHMVELS